MARKKLAGAMQLRFEGSDRFAAEMAVAAKEIKKEFTREAREVSKELKADTKPKMPKRSGALRKSMKHYARGNHKGFEAGLRSNLVYAPGLHFGRRQQFSGLTRKYGPPPRFGYQVLKDQGSVYSEKLLDAVLRVATKVGALHVAKRF